MAASPKNPDCDALAALISEAKLLLAKCDACGLSLVAIDICSAIDKMEELLRVQGKE